MQDIGEQVNDVRIRGRVSGAPRRRRLPSGDEVVSIRVVVPRTGEAPRGGSTRVIRSDTVECAAWSGRPQAAMADLLPDEHVFVTGALRRRFWRAGGAVASTFEVEVHQVERVPGPEPELTVTGHPPRRANDA